MSYSFGLPAYWEKEEEAAILSLPLFIAKLQFKLKRRKRTDRQTDVSIAIAATYIPVLTSTACMEAIAMFVYAQLARK